MRDQKFQGNIFVANLPPGLSDEDLAARFDQFGIVLGAFLARDPGTGATQTYGLVDIAPERAAVAAIAEMDGTEIGGQRIKVRPADREKGLTMPDRSRASRPAALHRKSPESARAPLQVEYVRPRRRA